MSEEELTKKLMTPMPQSMLASIKAFAAEHLVTLGGISQRILGLLVWANTDDVNKETKNLVLRFTTDENVPYQLIRIGLNDLSHHHPDQEPYFMGFLQKIEALIKEEEEEKKE